ncbi:MAG: DEAD/DEAH box helicase [Candidatus Colwellbacteria bacterium]|nr:DEAD/DEAH box helicase [Candidatus Colwellbacteria bacterium]
MQQNKDKNSGFYGLGIAPGILQILERLHLETPTPIQRQAIPVAIGGKDMIGIAQTGTGKTLAFGIPMLQILTQGRGQGLVLLPTRELALQVNEVFHKIGKSLGVKTTVLIGGLSSKLQIESIAKNPHIIIATPGRLLDHLEQKTVRLERVSILVLDEADRMLDMGFQPQIKRILQVIPKNRQTMLFSATLPPEIISIASSHMKLPVSIEVTPPGTTIENVSQEIFIVEKGTKPQLLTLLLKKHLGSTLIFTRTKYGAKRITKNLRELGEKVAEIHSNRSLSQRRDALEGFRSGRFRVLVATDIASRGIDVVGIETVINYDLPSQAGDYVHRIGRTGRAGMAGHAISFAMPEEKNDIRSIERLIRKNIPVSPSPTSLPKSQKVDAGHSGHRPAYYSNRKRNRS